MQLFIKCSFALEIICRVFKPHYISVLGHEWVLAGDPTVVGGDDRWGCNQEVES